MSNRRLLSSVAIAVVVLAIAACNNAATPTPLPTATPTPSVVTVNLTLNEWDVFPDRTTAPAGPVVFAATNVGALEHELVVLRTARPVADLAIDGETVDVATSGTLIGEIEPDELQPGQSASATWDLEAGNYALICNIPGHYSQGMFAGLTVN